MDILVANALRATDAVSWLPPEARLYESRGALDEGADGLDVLRRVAAKAPVWLSPGGFERHRRLEAGSTQTEGESAGGRP